MVGWWGGTKDGDVFCAVDHFDWRGHFEVCFMGSKILVCVDDLEVEVDVGRRVLIILMFCMMRRG
jgi:hypothetical protein